MGDTPVARIGIFLNLFDVHVTRAPIGGRVMALRYTKGRFLDASGEKASLQNERMAIRVAPSEGPEVAFVLVAGLVARRIVCDLREGQQDRSGAAHWHHPLRFPGRCLLSAALCPIGPGRAAHGRRRDSDRRPVRSGAGDGGKRAMRNWHADRTGRFRRRAARIRQARVQRFSDLSVNRMIPNVLTLLALCAGMTAIRFAIGENFVGAVFAIIVAGIFDGLDGRIARLLKSTSSFGAELDSLSDFVSFGVAPAAVLYLWTMSSLHGIGWAIVLFYAVCCALRLARFNIESDTARPAHSAPFFTGIPAPAGAGLVMVPMFLSFEWGDWLFRSPYLSAVTVTGIALLMVSKVPTVSLKRIRVPHRWVLPTLLGIGVLAAICNDCSVADAYRHRDRLCRLDSADGPLFLSATPYCRGSPHRGHRCLRAPANSCTLSAR